MTALFIVGGTIIDGTGNPPYRADLAVDDVRLRILRGPAAAPVGADQTDQIDAHGLIVAPGFIDMHSHSGLMILHDPQHLPKISQGVTTELVGVDGNSYAPFLDPEDLRRFVTFNAGLDGRPALDYDWDTVASYISKLDGAAVNLGCFVGNAALRICTVGWHDGPAPATARATMRSLLREGLEEGAFGLSTGLDYPPGSFAPAAEVADLCREVARLGALYHTHVRYDLGDQYLDPFREAFRIAESGACPLHITHFYCDSSRPHGADAMLELLDDEQRRGADVTFDGFPYEWGGTRLTYFLPQWLQSGGPDPTLERLSDPSTRGQFKDDLRAADPADTWRKFMSRVRVGNFTANGNKRYESRTASEIAAARGQDIVDAMCDLLVEEQLGLSAVGPTTTRAALPPFLAHPSGMIGTDSMFLGDKPSPRTFGSFPRILGEFVREERLFSLVEAIRKFTSMPARRLGLTDRGLLLDGFAADITIFDPAQVRALASHDQPRTQSEGIRHVIVNGVPVYRDGQPTGALPGRGLRRGR